MVLGVALQVQYSAVLLVTLWSTRVTNIPQAEIHGVLKPGNPVQHMRCTFRMY